MFNIDRRTIYIILMVIVLMNIASYFTSVGKMVALFLSLPGIFIAITFHEYAHAKVADMLGDETPRLQGRLTLNPFAHLDLFGTILLITCGFGWGKPVETNPRRYKRTIKMSTAEALVSAAGPLMNFIIAIICSLLFAIIGKYANTSNIYTGVILTIINSTMVINIGLGLFNLIPLYPLDGSKILKSIAPQKIRIWIEANEQILYYIFLALWLFGMFEIILTPTINVVYSLILNMFNFI